MSDNSNLMIYDLHTHSNKSDGVLSPGDLIARAKDFNVDVLSITDHDTVQAYQELDSFSEITIIPGIEFSALWRKSYIHIVGLNIHLDSQPLTKLIEYQSNTRLQRAEKILQRLSKKLQIDLSLDELQQNVDSANIGRPHIAKYLVQQGLVKNVQTAFDKYLGNGKIGDVKQGWPELEQVVQCILESEGIAVIAHPMKYNFTRTKLLECCVDFTLAGGQGIEIISGSQGKDITRNIIKIAEKLDMYASCGSDFHQPGYGWSELGQFGDFPVGAKPVWDLF